MAQRAILSWSGGKDSSLAFYEISRSQEFEVVSLLTTLTEDFDRISMHGVRCTLLEQQAESLGLPLEKVWISKGASNSEYEQQMGASLKKFTQDGISHIVFGDLFLQDIREYREAFLSQVGMKCVFPIWGRDTRALANFFLDSGFKAVICAVNPKLLGKEYCGLEFDRSFLSKVLTTVDPCGENGEFHTFVYDGPIFKRRVTVQVGEMVDRDGFFFADILPV